MQNRNRLSLLLILRSKDNIRVRHGDVKLRLIDLIIIERQPFCRPAGKDQSFCFLAGCPYRNLRPLYRFAQTLRVSTCVSQCKGMLCRRRLRSRFGRRFRRGFRCRFGRRFRFFRFLRIHQSFSLILLLLRLNVRLLGLGLLDFSFTIGSVLVRRNNIKRTFLRVIQNGDPLFPFRRKILSTVFNENRVLFSRIRLHCLFFRSNNLSRCRVNPVPCHTVNQITG